MAKKNKSNVCVILDTYENEGFIKFKSPAYKKKLQAELTSALDKEEERSLDWRSSITRPNPKAKVSSHQGITVHTASDAASGDESQKRALSKKRAMNKW